MTREEIAQHHINEDTKYHKMIKHLAEMEVHLEFYPDIATAVQHLVAPNLSEVEEQEWTDKYVEMINKAQNQKHTEVEAYLYTCLNDY